MRAVPAPVSSTGQALQRPPLSVKGNGFVRDGWQGAQGLPANAFEQLHEALYLRAAHRRALRVVRLQRLFLLPAPSRDDIEVRSLQEPQRVDGLP